MPKTSALKESVIQVRIAADIHEAVAAQAAARGVTISEYVRSLLADAVRKAAR